MKIPRLCSIALILCLIGCSSEDLVPSEKVCAVYLGSRQLLWDEGDTETKTTWDQTGSILWSESDRIKVLARKNGSGSMLRLPREMAEGISLFPLPLYARILP